MFLPKDSLRSDSFPQVRQHKLFQVNCAYRRTPHGTSILAVLPPVIGLDLLRRSRRQRNQQLDRSLMPSPLREQHYLQPFLHQCNAQQRKHSLCQDCASRSTKFQKHHRVALRRRLASRLCRRRAISMYHAPMATVSRKLREFMMSASVN